MCVCGSVVCVELRMCTAYAVFANNSYNVDPNRPVMWTVDASVRIIYIIMYYFYGVRQTHYFKALLLSNHQVYFNYSKITILVLT